MLFDMFAVVCEPILEVKCETHRHGRHEFDAASQNTLAPQLHLALAAKPHPPQSLAIESPMLNMAKDAKVPLLHPCFIPNSIP